MALTRPFFRTFIQTPALTRPFISKNASCLGIRKFNATPTLFEQSPEAESDLLRQQRKRRPVSPHLTIYQPQLTWYMSSLHRLTGVALGGTLYLSSMAYVIAPAFGYHFDAAAALAAFHSAPVAVKFATKLTLATPFVFHISNGIRHLIWDTTKCLDMKGVYRTGYAVLTVTAVGSVYLASM
ncbi:succinate dehydrogenase cytochrome b560 subunit [Backusella circina FSU 941]|nr:succinate dehydrogenase cytochrome b560 subunit [Backusella circina FSU 941]